MVNVALIPRAHCSHSLRVGLIMHRAASVGAFSTGDCVGSWQVPGGRPGNGGGGLGYGEVGGVEGGGGDGATTMMLSAKADGKPWITTPPGTAPNQDDCIVAIGVLAMALTTAAVSISDALVLISSRAWRLTPTSRRRSPSSLRRTASVHSMLTSATEANSVSKPAAIAVMFNVAHSPAI